jgi:hypothetical protein
MKEQNDLWVEILVKRANQYAQEGMKPYDAYELAASEFELPVAAEDGACRIYQTPNGQLENCWIG